MRLSDEERTDDLSEEKDNLFTIRGTNPTTQSTASTSSNMNLIILVIVLFLLMVLGLQYQIYFASVSLQQARKELKD